MVTVLTYKVTLLLVIAVAGGASGGITYYYQQQATDLNNKVSTLSTQININANQVSDLNGQVSQLQSQNTQLQSQLTQIQFQSSQLLSQNTQLLSNVTQLMTEINDLKKSPEGSTLSSGSVNVPFNGFSYIPFTIRNQTATLNLTFAITNFNSYYPQSIALYILNQQQYIAFQGGNYTQSSWSYPYATSLTNSQISLLAGSWYLALQEQDPNGGFPATASYNLQLVSAKDTLTSSAIASEVTLTNGCCPSTNDFSTGAPPTAVVSLGSLPYSGHITVSWLGLTNPSTRFSFTVQVNGVNTSTDITATGGFTISVFANAESNAWFTCYDYSTDQFGAHCNSNLTYSITYWH